uniref:Uncharacterized protein n=2 Tax=Anguilla anguilla TaxID=7936 RepID=A0A0E9URY3_ANGAN
MEDCPLPDPPKATSIRSLPFSRLLVQIIPKQMISRRLSHPGLIFQSHVWQLKGKRLGRQCRTSS